MLKVFMSVSLCDLRVLGGKSTQTLFKVADLTTKSAIWRSPARPLRRSASRDCSASRRKSAALARAALAGRAPTRRSACWPAASLPAVLPRVCECCDSASRTSSTTWKARPDALRRSADKCIPGRGRQDPGRTAAPISTLACSKAPVLRRCMSRSARPSSAACRRWPGRWPGRRPCPGMAGWPAPAVRHRPRLQGGIDAGLGRQHLEGQRLHRVAREHGLGFAIAPCTVGLPRRSTSLSMQGMSSWISE